MGIVCDLCDDDDDDDGDDVMMGRSSTWPPFWRICELLDIECGYCV